MIDVVRLVPNEIEHTVLAFTDDPEKLDRTD
jgi:hypothetical protein